MSTFEQTTHDDDDFFTIVARAMAQDDDDEKSDELADGLDIFGMLNKAAEGRLDRQRSIIVTRVATEMQLERAERARKSLPKVLIVGDGGSMAGSEIVPLVPSWEPTTAPLADDGDLFALLSQAKRAPRASLLLGTSDAAPEPGSVSPPPVVGASSAVEGSADALDGFFDLLARANQRADDQRSVAAPTVVAAVMPSSIALQIPVADKAASRRQSNRLSLALEDSTVLGGSSVDLRASASESEPRLPRNSQGSGAGGTSARNSLGSSGAMASGASLTPSGSFLRRLSKGHGNDGEQLDLLPPLALACPFYSDTHADLPSPDAVRALNRVAVAAGRMDTGTTLLVARAAGWVAETQFHQDSLVPVPPPQILPEAQAVGGDGSNGAAQWLQQVVEFDQHSRFYAEHFLGQDHHNFVGSSDDHGPLAISVQQDESDAGIVWRVVVRSGKQGTRRFVLLEKDVPCKPDGQPSHFDVLVRAFGGDDALVRSLHQARVSARLPMELRTVDECAGNSTRAYKIGVLSCESNQETEAQMYNNEISSPAFAAFLATLAPCVSLAGFTGFRGGLDVKCGQSGVFSHHVRAGDTQIMFHVATLLPFDANDPQQLLRKRHIGNDIVTVVFQEPGALPFDPSDFRSHFQKTFVIVRAANIATPQLTYSVATTRSNDVPAFGPPLPAHGACFDAAAINDGRFAAFLLAKIINAENAAYHCEALHKLSSRTRLTLLGSVVAAYAGDVPVNGAPRAKESVIANFIRRTKSTKSQPGKTGGMSNPVDLLGFDSQPAPSWAVHLDRSWSAASVQPPCAAAAVAAVVIVAPEIVAVLEEGSHALLHCVPTSAVRGWTVRSPALVVWYGKRAAPLPLVCGGAAQCAAVADMLAVACPGAGVARELRIVRQSSDVPWGLTLRSAGQVESGGSATADLAEVVGVMPDSVAVAAGVVAGLRLLHINALATPHRPLSELETAARASPHVLLLRYFPVVVAPTTSTSTHASVAHDSRTAASDMLAEGGTALGAETLETKVAELEARLAALEGDATHLLRRNVQLERENRELRSPVAALMPAASEQKLSAHAARSTMQRSNSSGRLIASAKPLGSAGASTWSLSANSTTPTLGATDLRRSGSSLAGIKSARSVTQLTMQSSDI